MDAGQQLRCLRAEYRENGDSDQVALFETDACHDYWVMWSYEVGEPDLYQFSTREDAERQIDETVKHWTESEGE